MADLHDEDRRRALQLTPVSRETEERLSAYVRLLLLWQQKTNLVSPATLPHLWTRHISDSLQLLDLSDGARSWIDLGSGGGFPGLAIACALADIPGARVHLVESNGKKAAFLREAGRVTGAPVMIHTGRVEDVVDRISERVEIVTARALAPLSMLLDYAYPLMAAGSRALFLKGQDVASELTDAAKYWTLEDLHLTPSRTDRHGQIVAIRQITPRRAPHGAATTEHPIPGPDHD